MKLTGAKTSRTGLAVGEEISRKQFAVWDVSVEIEGSHGSFNPSNTFRILLRYSRVLPREQSPRGLRDPHVCTESNRIVLNKTPALKDFPPKRQQHPLWCHRIGCEVMEMRAA